MNKRVISLSANELEKKVLQEKEKGTPDIEIGEKYGAILSCVVLIVT